MPSSMRPRVHLPIVFLLRETAIAEAYAQALRAREFPAVCPAPTVLHEPQTLLAEDYSLMVIEPSLLVTSVELMQTQNQRWLLYANQARPSLLELALKCRACGFVTPQISLNTLLDACVHLATGQLREYWSPDAERQLVYQGPQRQVAAGSILSQLTRRQIEVLAHLAEGKTVKEVAQLMHLSQKSVDSHKYRIMNRLKIHDRVHLSRLAIREGLIEA